MNARIEKINGNRMIVIDNAKYLPVAYRSFRPMPSNINQFYRCGVRLYQIQVSGRKNMNGVPYSYYGGVWVGEGKYDYRPFDEQINMVKKFAPEAKIMVMIQLDTPLWWLEKHPDSKDSYYCIGEAAFDEEWIKDAADYINNFVEYAEKNYGNDIFAYSFSGGIATEWFDKLEYYVPSDKKERAYKEYSGGLDVPNKTDLNDVSGICMREPNSKEAVYRNFCCTLTPKLIKRFAKIFKEKTNYNKIVGLFFGYTDCPSAAYQIASSTNGYEEVWKDKNIDMLFAPASYSYGDNSRELNGASSYQYLVDSVDLNGKLYLHEIDHRTHLAQFPLENGTFLSTYEDLFTTREVLRRELVTALCKGGSLWWFDFYGNYYACPELEEEISLQIKAANTIIQKERKSVSEIAVFADPMGFNLLKEKLNLTVDYVRKNRNNLHMCGAPFDYYNLNDITKIDVSKYKMFVFLFAPVISEDVRNTIDKLDNKMKVYIHLPDVASKESLDFSAMEKLVGIKLSEEKQSEKAIYNDKTFGFHTKVSPLYKIVDNVQVMANYENGDIAAGIKNNNAYIGVSDVPSQLWHDLAKISGVHIYTDKSTPVYADSRFIACQFPENRSDVLYLKEDGEYIEVFSGKEYKSVNKMLEFKHYNYQMMCFVKKS